MSRNSMDPFSSDMDDLFNELMRGMNGMNSERHYLINGREVTPEELAQYQKTGKLPGAEDNQPAGKGNGPAKDSMLARIGRNLTTEAREGNLDPVIGRNKEFKKQLKFYHGGQRITQY